MTTWMVVEDEPDLYDMVLAMYSTMGVDGLSFATGEEAFEWIEEVENGYAGDELPELVLLDIRLPGKIDGISVGERLRKSPKLNSIVIVLMTAYKLQPRQEKQAMRRSGADLLIYKPLPALNDLKNMLEELVAAS